MRYLILLLAIAAIVLPAFNWQKCEHVFTQVEQAAVKMERPGLYSGVTLSTFYWPSGLQEGKELICVKCYHKQKQVMDYGQVAGPTNTLTEGLWGLSWDTLRATNGSSRNLFIKGDSLIFKAATLPWPFVTAEVRGDLNIGSNSSFVIDSSGRLLIDTTKKK